MGCLRCGRALDDDARFCPACGLAVEVRCKACDASLDSDARFCKHCGTAVEAAAGATEHPATSQRRDHTRERKVATLLFADLVGFTNLGERHDPELVSALVGETFERLSVEVRRYEGTIEKFAGDALLAVFGVPVAHEDDPERAVRTALEMQAVMAGLAATPGEWSELTLRIGIATGEVLVDQSRATEERDLFVTGDAVNTAARLEAAAAPGTVVVGPSTYGATRDVVDYSELAALDLKGKGAPVVAWQAVAVKSGRGGRRARKGLESPLVGRDNELTLLKETVRRTVADGRPHLVTVMGSAGVGKSRLAWELEKYLDGLPDAYHWRKGRCLAYAGPSFGPVADVVRADARILDDDPPEAAQDKLRARLSALDVGDDEPAIADALQAVLGIAEPRERPREELFEAWERYLRAIARLEPLVLVVEDIHWADDGVLSFLDFVARWGEGPMVILCLARHELLRIRPGWGGGLSNAATIDLEPLDPEASLALMGGLLEGGVPHRLRDRIIGLSEGNPLFAEEMVRMLIDRGALRFVDGQWQLTRPVHEVEIPGSVQAVLAARLDTLPEHEKRVAQDAAVVGRIFWDRLVAHISNESLPPTSERIRGLRVKDLVVPREPSTLAGAAEYSFRHVLIRDVAYDSLPKKDRAVLHREIAEWAEGELADRVEEFGELIASHLAAAVAYEEEFDVGDGRGLQEVRRLAYTAELRASRRAWSMSQADEAVRWLRQAIELAWKLELPVREIVPLALEYREMSFTIGDPDQQLAVATPVLEALLALPDRIVDDEPVIARLRGMIGAARFHQNDVEGSRAMIRLAIGELDGERWPDVLGYLHSILGWTYWRAGPVAEAVPVLETAVRLATEAGDDHTLRWAMHDLGVSLSMLGQHDAGVAHVEESQQLARDADDHNLIMRCLINVPSIRGGRGDDIRPILEYSEEAIRYARRAAADSAVCWIAGNIGGVMVELGRLDEALAYQDEAVRLAEVYVPDILKSKLVDRALLHRVRGEPSLAEADQVAASNIATDPEPQLVPAHVRGRAVAAWQEDPAAALALAVATMRDESLPAEARVTIAHDTARIALRLRTEPELAEAVALTAISEKPASPTFDAWRAWEEGLVDGTDGATVERAARELEGLGLLALAVEAWSDAAILAARAARSSDSLRAATTLAESIGMHPLLGPLPETRWLEEFDAEPATGSAT